MPNVVLPPKIVMRVWVVKRWDDASGFIELKVAAVSFAGACKAAVELWNEGIADEELHLTQADLWSVAPQFDIHAYSEW